LSDKLLIYSDEGIRSWDHLYAANDSVVGIARATQLLLGGAQTVGFGFGASVQTSPNMSINIAAGQILSWAPLDYTNNAAFPPDTRMILHSGYNDAETLVFDISDLTAGQSQCFLIQASFEQQDIIRVGDPDNGVLPFVNSANLLEPFAGQNNNAGTLPTVRNGFANVQKIAGTIAGTGQTPTPPSPTGNAIGLWIVTVEFGDIAISSGMLEQYPNSPIVAGLLNQHHTGAAGQAPKIDVTEEIQGIVPLLNLPVSNNSPASVGGIVVVPGSIPIAQQITVNPNGNLAGKVNDRALNESSGIEYVCTTTGTAAGAGSTIQAVWTPVGGTQTGPTNIYRATSPTNASNSYANYLMDCAAANANLTLNLPAVSSVTNAQIGITLIGENTAENLQAFVAPAGSDKFIINGQVVTGNLALSQVGDSRTLTNLTIASGPMAGTYWVVQ
jgi:hypothetical protein